MGDDWRRASATRPSPFSPHVYSGTPTTSAGILHLYDCACATVTDSANTAFQFSEGGIFKPLTRRNIEPRPHHAPRLLEGQSHPSKPRSTPNPTNQSARVLCATRRTKRNSARSTTKPAIPIPNALTPSFFVILCHHHPYSIALRLIWRRAHGPTHREPPFIPPTEPGNAALVRAPSTRGCVSAGRWHLNRRRCAHVRLHGFDQFRPYGVRTRTAHGSPSYPSP